MNTLKHSEQTSVPVDQPTGWPRLYLIPETITIPPQRPASNAPVYHEPVLIKLNPPLESKLHRFICIETEIFQETCADAWAALKEAGRDTIRWVARWVILPASIACAIWVPFSNPAELPM